MHRERTGRSHDNGLREGEIGRPRRRGPWWSLARWCEVRFDPTANSWGLSAIGETGSVSISMFYLFRFLLSCVSTVSKCQSSWGGSASPEPVPVPASTLTSVRQPEKTMLSRFEI